MLGLKYINSYILDLCMFPSSVQREEGAGEGMKYLSSWLISPVINNAVALLPIIWIYMYIFGCGALCLENLT